jgi:hypothetical protein
VLEIPQAWEAAALSCVFAAGGYVAAIRQTRREVNGLGRKVTRVVALLVRWADTEEKRREVAELMEGK